MENVTPMACVTVQNAMLVQEPRKSAGVTWLRTTTSASYAWLRVRERRRFIRNQMELVLQVSLAFARENQQFAFVQVRHKSVCSVTEAAWNLEMSDLRRKEIVLSV